MSDEYARQPSDTGGLESQPGPVGDLLWRLFVPVLALTPLIVGLLLRAEMELSYRAVGVFALISALLLGVAAVLLRNASIAPSGAQPAQAQLPDPAAVEDQAPGGNPVDPLSRLPTFHPFSQRLMEEFQLVKYSGTHVAVVLIDINHLAGINQEFGPAAGDKVLLHVAACLESTKRQSDMLARMGDDEFALVLLDCGEEGARSFIQRLQDRLARDPVEVAKGTAKGKGKGRGKGTNKASLWVGICAGMAVCDPHAQNADEVLTAAIDDLNASRLDRDRRRDRWEQSS